MNSGGSSTDQVQLTFGSSSSHPNLPKITKKPENIQALLGQPVELSCEYESDGVPEVFWFKNGERIGKSGNIDIEIDEKKSKMKILQLDEENLGEYSCKISNNYGEDLAKAMILLEGMS